MESPLAEGHVFGTLPFGKGAIAVHRKKRHGKSDFDLSGTKPSPGGKVPRPSLRGIKGRMRDGDILPDHCTNGYAFPGTISTVAVKYCSIGEKAREITTVRCVFLKTQHNYIQPASFRT